MRNEISSKIDEVSIVDAYLSNQISGVYDCENFSFLPVRITGLGYSQRFDEDETKRALFEALTNFQNIEVSSDMSFDTLKELAKKCGLQPQNYKKETRYCRDASEFASERMLEAYAGLPLIREHPKTEGGMLNQNNIQQNPIVGTIIKAYMHEGSVWGIAKIYDKSIFADLENLGSTSPAVETFGIITNDGTKHEQVMRLNHLAFVSRGYWDTYSGENAIDLSNLTFEKGDNEMSFADEIVIDEAKIDSITQQAATPEVSKAKVDNDDDKVDNDDDKVDNDDDKVDNDDDKVDDDDDKVDDDDDKVDNDDDKVDDEVKGEKVKDEDEEREALIDHFRGVCDSYKGKLSMPYIAGRKHPGAVLSAILNQNFLKVSPKYKGIVLESQAYPKQNYSLMLDAYNDMLSTIEKRESRKPVGKGFQPTERANVRIDRNF